MKFSELAFAILCAIKICYAAPIEDAINPQAITRSLAKRQGFDQGQPIDGKGRGAPFSGGTNHELDLQNPDNLGRAGETDNGVVPNLKWSFSDSRTRLFKGGWIRESVVTDLPSSPELSAAQVHLTKGAIRELHWHSVSEWGYVLAGSARVAALDEDGRNQIDTVKAGDIWYFPKGAPHTIQGITEQSEVLLVFDDGDFDAIGTTFEIDDWLAHTPKSILAKNFGVNESVFDALPKTDPFILPPIDVSNATVEDPKGTLEGNSSFIYKLSDIPPQSVPGGGGTLAVIDSRNFPVAKTIAGTVVKLEPGGLRELHWHPNAAEWLYFQSGYARATVFIGQGNARTFDFSAGDTAIFPDNSGHYIENTSKTEDLHWLEFYKSDRVVDISVTQWLALTPPDIAANTLGVSVEVIKRLSKTKQILLKGDPNVV